MDTTKVYVVISQSLLSTSSYYDVEGVYGSHEKASAHIGTAFLDFMHGIDRGDFGEDMHPFSLYVEQNEDSCTIEDFETGYWIKWRIEEFEIQ